MICEVPRSTLPFWLFLIFGRLVAQQIPNYVEKNDNLPQHPIGTKPDLPNLANKADETINWPTEFPHVEDAPLPTSPKILTDDTFQDEIRKNDLVFVNYHAEWCPYSRMLNPIFDDAWNQTRTLHPQAKVLFGKVDCDKSVQTCTQSQVSKYPTLKIFRLGTPRSEYRAKRDASSIVTWISDQLNYRVTNLSSIAELDVVSLNKSAIITLFDHYPPEIFYKTLQMIGFLMKEDCNIYVAAGPEFKQLLGGHPAKAMFKPAHLNHTDVYEGKIDEFDHLSQWIFDKCTPFIREITRENAEEITERALPLLILFYDPAHMEPLKIFSELVTQVLTPYANKIQPVYAKAESFIHPLHHLGKTEADLPVIAIDSFAHMFPFPHKFSDLEPTPGHPSHEKLKQFVEDLFSQKLHKDYHAKADEEFWQQVAAAHGIKTLQIGGPFDGIDRKPGQAGEPAIDNRVDKNNAPVAGHHPHGHPNGHGHHQNEQIPPRKAASIPESTFQKLQPSYTRYTLLRTRDEL